MIASINVALLFLSRIGDVSSAPTVGERSKSFSIPAVYNQLKPHSVLGKRDHGSVSANYNAGVLYSCPVTIGGQTLNLILDTGSADLWVYSNLLPTSDLNGHSYYNITKSSTYRQLPNHSFQITYLGGGSASGIVGTDITIIGSITVQTQAIEVANNLIGNLDADGVVGLAQQGNEGTSLFKFTPESQSTFFQNAQMSLDSPIFAAYLPYETTGAFDFGALNGNRYTGAIQYAAVDRFSDFWEFDSESYMVGGQVFEANGVTGHADTGASVIYMQPDQVMQYFKNVEGAIFNELLEAYTFPCTASLPTLSFLIGPTNWATIPGQSLIYEHLSGSICLSALQFDTSGDQPDDINHYGLPFLNQYYAVFDATDATNPKFGFATLV